MKLSKRVTALALSLLLIIGALPLAAVAATIDKLEDHTYTLLWTTDPQWYSFAYPEIITHQNEWVLNNYERLDIRYTFHTGDFVDNPHSTEQWTIMDNAYRPWDEAGYPYGILAGNHDVDGSDHTEFSQYFGKARYENNAWYGGDYDDHFGHYDLMTIDGTDFIFVYMGYNSSYPDAVYNWLNSVLSQHVDRVATLCFHDYLQADGTRSPNGEAFFRRVVLKNPNVRMVMCGHNYNSTRKIDTIDDNGDGKADRTVYQIMANYQSTTKGGNGFMRFMECDTAAGEIVCRTYSPYTETFGSDYEDDVAFDEYGTRDSFTIPFDFSAPTAKASGDPEYGTVVYEPTIAFATTDSDAGITLPVTYQNVAESGASYNGIGVYDRYFSADATDAFSDPKALDYVIARYTQGKGYAISWIVDGAALADGEIVTIPHDGIVITLPDNTVALSRLNIGRKIVAKSLYGITTPSALKPITLMINGTVYSVNAANRLTGNNEWVLYDSFTGASTSYAHTWDMLFACAPVSDTTYSVAALSTTLGTDKTLSIPTGGFVLAVNTYSGGKLLAESLRRLLTVGTQFTLDGYVPGEGATYNKQSILPPSASDWTAETNAAAATENGAQVLYKSGGADSGTWPSTDYIFPTPITIDPANTAIAYDYTLETNGKVNIILYFNGTTPSTGTSATKLSIQSYFSGANISSGSGDVKGDDVARAGKIDLSAITFPDGCYNSDGTLMLSAIRVMNAGYVGKKLILRELALTNDLRVESDDEVEQTIPLVNPDITITDETLAGGYTYDNGQLTVTANSDSGYEVTVALDKAVNVSVLKNWLVNVSSTADFDVKLKVTTAGADASYGLVSDFYPSYTGVLSNDCIPVGSYSKLHDLLSCYTYNNVLPADSISIIKEVTIKLASVGTLSLFACQLTNTTYGGYFADGICKTETTPKNVLESSVYSIQDGLLVGVVHDTTLAQWLANVSSDYTVTVYENGAVVSGDTLAKTGQTVTVTSGDKTLVSYTMVVEGDTLGTGKLSTSGMRLILKYTMGLVEFTDAQKVAADADDNGIVNTNDVRQLLKML